MFDQEAWTKLWQFQEVAFAPPHLSLLKALTVENQRALPQQALSTVTNVDDIETYLSRLGVTHQQTFLTVVDLSFDDRKEILRELSLMGITAASLFPGLDGACEEMKARLFGY